MPTPTSTSAFCPMTTLLTSSVTALLLLLTICGASPALVSTTSTAAAANDSDPSAVLELPSGGVNFDESLSETPTVAENNTLSGSRVIDG